MTLKELMDDLEKNLAQSGMHELLPTDDASAHYLNELSEAFIHPLAAGGKRIRPKLTLLMALSLGGLSAKDQALRAARALELVHTYSLVHDDLPCMDNDDLRRGKPTTHKIYGEAKALLVGDALLTEAFRVLAELQPHLLPNLVALAVGILAERAGHLGMIAGQWLDISFESAPPASPLRSTFNIETLRLIHNLKTGCLLSAALELGALCGLNELEVSNQTVAIQREASREAGSLIGLSFQLVDDLLDATSSTQKLGKTAGKDAQQGKQTAVDLLGVEKTQELAQAVTTQAQSLLGKMFERTPATSPMAKKARKELEGLVASLASRVC